jgi:acyl-CoA reductase-like NAD-dependent aldehyde dehydrogenase
MPDPLLYIGGRWRPGRAGSAPAVSPSSGQEFASVAVADVADVAEAVEAANQAAPGWARLSAFDRAAWCDQVAAAIERHGEELGRVLTTDQGKPLASEARDEVSELAGYFRMAAADVRRLDGLAPPSVSAGRRVLVSRHVGQAVERGARVCCGGRLADGFPTALFAEPTVLDHVTPDMDIAREETFGPVVPVIEVASAAEALELMNGSPYGLTAAVFTADLERGMAFAEDARAGWVNINASTNLWESHLPFGGRAGSVSGRGRVGGAWPMEAFTEPKTVVYPAPQLRA